MGTRGQHARPLWRRTKPDPNEVRPWEDPKLSRADKVIAFCESLTVTSGAKQGEKLRLREWQKDFIRAVYTTRPNAEGRVSRQVRTAVLTMGRKNGKTQLAAALALCHLSGPESEMRGEIYACANDRFQASKIYNEMDAMITQSPWLDCRCNVSRFRKDIEDFINKSVYFTLTAEARTKMGLSPSFVVYDELGQARDRELYDAMDSAMGAREDPLMLVISTQAANDAAPMSQLVDYGLKVQSGEIVDPSFHLTIYAAPDDANPWDLETWHMANPALGDFRSLEDVRRLAQQAQRIPTQENPFRNLILNQRVAAEARFMEPSQWKKCAGPVHIPRGQPVYAGLDLGSTRDLTSFVYTYEDINGLCHLKCHTWVPGALKERGDQDGAPYETWARQGLIIPAGKATDPRAVAQKIGEVHRVNPIRGLAFDRWRMNELEREFEYLGIPYTLPNDKNKRPGAIMLIPFGQGFKDMSSAVDTIERLVVNERLRHGGDPVLTWCANNAVVMRDPAGGRKFNKSGTQYSARIDALVAASMALASMLVKGDMAKPLTIDVEALIG